MPAGALTVDMYVFGTVGVKREVVDFIPPAAGGTGSVVAGTAGITGGTTAGLEVAT
jgi:hypothetical protein